MISRAHHPGFTRQRPRSTQARNRKATAIDFRPWLKVRSPASRPCPWRAFPSHGRGRRFNPYSAHQLNQQLRKFVFAPPRKLMNFLLRRRCLIALIKCRVSSAVRSKSRQDRKGFGDLLTEGWILDSSPTMRTNKHIQIFNSSFFIFSVS